MKKTLLSLALVGLTTSMAHAETVRLIISGDSNKQVIDIRAKSSQQSTITERCIVTPNGQGDWCIPTVTKGAVSEAGLAAPYKKVELESFGYSAGEISSYFNDSGISLLVEADAIATTPNIRPIILQESGLVQEQNSEDPNSSSQTRYYGNPDDLVLGMGVFELWENVEASNKVDPIDVLVLDSSFYASPEVNYADGRSFSMVPLTTGGDEQARNDDFSPRQESVDQGLCTGHGLGVAGAIGATMDNGIAGAGVTNNINLHAIRVMTCGSGYLSDSADALLWMSGTAFDGITPYTGKPGIVNMSLSSSIAECPAFMQKSIDQANDAGFTIVVAAANKYADVADYTPANCDGVTVVGALEKDGSKAAFSNSGEEVDISAAGTDIIAPCTEAGTACSWDGTSFATPIVVGVLAAIKQDTGARSSALEAALKLTARKGSLGAGCEGDVCGAGVPNAMAALTLARNFTQGGLDVIEFALSDNDTCEQTWFTGNFGQSLTLCELYKLTFLGGYELQNTAYQLLSIEMGGDWDDAIQVSVLERPIEYVSDLDVLNNEYGYRLCTNGECSGDVFKLNADKAQEEFRPAGCQ
jgi:serine protease